MHPQRVAIGVLTAVLVASLLPTLAAPTASAAPTVVEVQVVTGSDDAEENANGDVSLTSSDLELIQEGSPQVVGIRFAGIPVLPGQLITSAYLQFTADEDDAGPADLVIHGQAAVNPQTFSSGDHGISSRPVTSSSATWSPPAWTNVGDAGPGQRTGDLSAVVQELVNQSGWAPGNAMAFIITGSGVRTAESFNGGEESAPVLHNEDINRYHGTYNPTAGTITIELDLTTLGIPTTASTDAIHYD